MIELRKSPGTPEQIAFTDEDAVNLYLFFEDVLEASRTSDTYSEYDGHSWYSRYLFEVEDAVFVASKLAIPTMRYITWLPQHVWLGHDAVGITFEGQDALNLVRFFEHVARAVVAEGDGWAAYDEDGEGKWYYNYLTSVPSPVCVARDLAMPTLALLRGN